MKEDMGSSGPSEFFSTHPSSSNRIKKITEWTNDIILKYPPISV